MPEIGNVGQDDFTQDFFSDDWQKDVYNTDEIRRLTSEYAKLRTKDSFILDDFIKEGTCLYTGPSMFYIIG